MSDMNISGKLISFAKNILKLFKFDEIIVKVSSGEPARHAYSIELNKDGTVTLHEPYNSRNGVIDEFLNLNIKETAVVMVL